MTDLPPFVISIRQPWAWLIVNGYKNVENRTWRRAFTGPVCIHASQKIDVDAQQALFMGQHPVDSDFSLPPGCAERFIEDTKTVPMLGGIVGTAEITGCVSDLDSPWFVGPYGFTLANARPAPFVAMPGKLGIFRR